MTHLSPVLIELVYFARCPNVSAARENLRRALIAAGRSPVWDEWEQSHPNAPRHVRRMGSPTVLVNGRDVTGADPDAGGAACRALGAPSPEQIGAALAQVGRI